MWIIPSTLSNFVQDMQEFISDSNEQSRVCASLLLVRSKPSQLRTWSAKWKRDSWTQHLSGRILKPSRVAVFTDLWTFWLQVSRVSPSVKPVNEQEPRIRDTFSLTSFDQQLIWDSRISSLRMSKGSSQPKPLTNVRSSKSIATRLHRDLEQHLGSEFTLSSLNTLESPFCSMSSENWKEWVTQQRLEYSVRLKSELPTSGSGCLSSQKWRTPNALLIEPKPKGTKLSGRTPQDPQIGLADQVVYGPHDQESSNTVGSRRESWSTPHANCSTGVGQSPEKQGAPNIQTQVQSWGTHTANAIRSGARSAEFNRPSLTPIEYATQKNAKLNSRWVETLMGLRIGWTMPSCTAPVTIEPMSCGCSETGLCRTQPNEHGESCHPDWRTPAAQDPGIKAERLIGDLGGRLYDKHTGRNCQYGLNQQVEISEKE